MDDDVWAFCLSEERLNTVILWHLTQELYEEHDI